MTTTTTPQEDQALETLRQQQARGFELYQDHAEQRAYLTTGLDSTILEGLREKGLITVATIRPAGIVSIDLHLTGGR